MDDCWKPKFQTYAHNATPSPGHFKLCISLQTCSFSLPSVVYLSCSWSTGQITLNPMAQFQTGSALHTLIICTAIAGVSLVMSGAGPLWAPESKTAVTGRATSRAQDTSLSEKLQNAMRSMFAFASWDLEAHYQKYVANSVSWYACCCSVMIIIAWMSFFVKVRFGPAAARAVLPPVVSPLACNFVPAVALVLLIHLKPAAYAKRYRLIHLLMSVFQMGVANYMREIFIWMHSESFRGLSGHHSFNAFMAENFYLGIMWVRVLCFPVDQVTDLAVATSALFLNLAGNNHLCSSPLLGPLPVTLSRPVMVVLHWVSPWLLSVLVPGAEGPQLGCTAPPCQVPCPVALVFWEILGWWISCVSVVLREVISRRAFLAANHHLLNHDHVTQAHTWPFGSALLVSNCITGAVLLYFMGSLLWAGSLILYLQH